MEFLGPVLTTQREKLENGSFTLKTHQMFSVHTWLEKFENAIITVHFGFVFEKTSGSEIA